MLTKGHYHCVECGSLFEADVKDVREQRCPVCGNPPTGKILAGTKQDRALAPVVRASDVQAQPARERHGVSLDSVKISEATIEAQGKRRRGEVKRTKRRESKSKAVWIVIGVWLLLMAGIVGVMSYLKTVDDEGKDAHLDDGTQRERILAEAEAKKNLMEVNAAVPVCQRVLLDFLKASSAAAKAQFVYHGAKLSGIMHRYYRNNPTFSSTRGDVKITRGEMLEIPGVKALGTLCKNNDGERFEVIFVKSGKEWKIDWESLVRYDNRNWSMFPAGNDGDEGEFRLYMRVRDSVEDFEREDVSVVFYKPSMYLKGEFSGLASSVVRVPVDSSLGKKVRELRDAGDRKVKDAYGFTVGGFDPASYHRVRARLRLHKEKGGEARMELLEIPAYDWYGQGLTKAAEKAKMSEGGE